MFYAFAVAFYGWELALPSCLLVFHFFSLLKLSHFLSRMCSRCADIIPLSFRLYAAWIFILFVYYIINLFTLYLIYVSTFVSIWQENMGKLTAAIVSFRMPFTKMLGLLMILWILLSILQNKYFLQTTKLMFLMPCKYIF